MPKTTHLLALALTVSLTAAAALAEKKVVTLKDGRTITGEVTETEKGYRVETDSYALTFTRDQVESIGPVKSPEALYRDKAAEIDPNSAAEHVKLGRWAMRVGLLAQARTEFQRALELEEGNDTARLLLKVVESRLASGDGDDGGEEGDDDGGGDDGAGSTTGRFPLIKKQDIYRIRFEEFRRGERLPVRFKNDVVDRFIEMMQGREEFRKQDADRRFKGLPRIEQALYMRPRLEDLPEMKDDIEIRRDPRFMRDFQARVWPIVRSSCATTDCHGGARPRGGLMFVRLGAGNERVAYTNFVILDGTMVGSRRLIDRNAPEDSLLLQYGLPPKQSKVDHPVKIQHAFPNRDAGGYKRILSWIQSLSRPMHPAYRLDYKPPYGMTLNSSKSTGSLDFLNEDKPADDSTTQPSDGEGGG